MIRLVRNTLLFFCTLLTAPLFAALKSTRRHDVDEQHHAQQLVVNIPPEQMTLDDIMGYSTSDPADQLSRKRHHVALKRALHQLYPSELSSNEKQLQLKAILDYTLNGANHIVHRNIRSKEAAKKEVNNLFSAARSQINKTFDADTSNETCHKALNFLKALQAHTSHRALYNAARRQTWFWSMIGVSAGTIGGLCGLLWWHNRKKRKTLPPIASTSVTPSQRGSASEVVQPQPSQVSAPLRARADVLGAAPNTSSDHDNLQVQPTTDLTAEQISQHPAETDNGRRVTSPSPAAEKNTSTTSNTLSVIRALTTFAARTGGRVAVRVATTENPHPAWGIFSVAGWASGQTIAHHMPNVGTATAGVVAVRQAYQHRGAIQETLFPTPSQLAARDNPHPRATAAIRGAVTVGVVVGAAAITYYFFPDGNEEALEQAMNCPLVQEAAGQATSYVGQITLTGAALAVENWQRVQSFPGVQTVSSTVSSAAHRMWNAVPDMPWWLGGRG